MENSTVSNTNFTEMYLTTVVFLQQRIPDRHLGTISNGKSRPDR